MATSETIAMPRVSESAVSVPNLLSTAAMIGGENGRDDALRQRQPPHIGAELGAPEEGERQRRALHGLEPVRHAVGHHDEERSGQVVAGQQGDREAERQHHRSEAPPSA